MDSPQGRIAVELFIHGSTRPTPATVSSRTIPLAETATAVAVFKVVDFITMFKKPTKETCKTSFEFQGPTGLEQLPQFLEHGIDSLKIEGRMKSNLYVATTTRVYAQGLKVCATEPPPLWQSRPGTNSGIERIPHRGYTEASLNTPAGKTYLSGHRRATL